MTATFLILEMSCVAYKMVSIAMWPKSPGRKFGLKCERVSTYTFQSLNLVQVTKSVEPLVSFVEKLRRESKICIIQYQKLKKETLNYQD